MTDGFIKVMVALADSVETAKAEMDLVKVEHTGTPTEIILKEMLTESTGASILDSGSAYGRNWQRNQGRDFDAEIPTHIKFSAYNGKPEIEFTHNVYHWLKERLEYNEELDTIFHGRFLKERDDNSKGWLELMNEFPGYLAEIRENDGIADDGEGVAKPKVGDECPNCKNGTLEEGEPMCINTYNGEDALSQVLQYVLFSGDAGEFVILQIHGGCDVRGGYTKPRVFSFGNLSELDITDNARGAIHCTGEDRLPSASALKETQEHQVKIPGVQVTEIDFDGSREHYWTTDDACHWYDQGSFGCGAGDRLEKYEVVNLDDEDEAETPWEPGKLFIKDGVGYCPYCGAKLAGSSY